MLASPLRTSAQYLVGPRTETSNTHAEPRLSEADRAVVEALKDLSRPRKSWLTAAVILGVTLVLFASMEWLENPVVDIAILIGVILAHEMGHYVGMRLFHYQNVQMFFIPLFAAVFLGRVYCGGVCPLGAIQELVALWPV